MSHSWDGRNGRGSDSHWRWYGGSWLFKSRQKLQGFRNQTLLEREHNVPVVLCAPVQVSRQVAKGGQNTIE